jgi:formylglycine-generating enzyme required for sulfatase activity
MADVFISYKRDDLAVAERVIAGLRKEGLSTWWDERITPLASWDATIEKEISEAMSVVVLWTPRSVTSDWVRTEAHYAQEHGKLVPVLLENCEIPIAFLLRQTIHLSTWNGDGDHREWRKLLTWIGDLRSRKSGNAAQVSQPSGKPNPFRDAIGHLSAGDPVVDGGFVNMATPAGTAFRDGDQLPVMRILPKGTFLLGSPQSDPDRSPVEGPQRRIEIPVPFALGVHPVLVAEYRMLIGQLPVPASAAIEAPRWRFFQPKRPQNVPTTTFVDTSPMTWISFGDAQTLVDKLSNATGERYRIPSEAEWEYACRSGSQTRYAFGDRLDTTMALFGSPVGPAAAGSYRPNAFGLYDMHGNVREWTADLWHESYDSTPFDGSPAIDGHGSMRVVRGGGWCDDPSLLRSATRMRATESTRSHFIGVRIARALG